MHTHVHTYIFIFIYMYIYIYASTHIFCFFYFLKKPGWLDVVAVYGNTTSWFRNVQGIFETTPHEISTMTYGASSVISADLNQDNWPDVIVGSRDDHTLAWWPNLNGTFVPGQFQTISNNTLEGIGSILATDLNRDGLVDIIATIGERSPSPNYFPDDEVGMAWWRNINGTAFESVPTIVPNIGLSVASLFAGDLDRDGWTDIAVASRYDNTIAWHANLQGTIDTNRRIVSAKNRELTSVFVFDSTRNGWLDILACSWADGKTSLFRNLGRPLIDPIPNYLSTNIYNPQVVFAADLHRNGYPDVIAGGAQEIKWWPNINGTLDESQVVEIIKDFSFIDSLFVADLNRDGYDDIISCLRSSDKVKVIWWPNIGGTFNNDPQTIGTGPDSCRHVQAADINRDGWVDVLVSGNENDDPISLYMNDQEGNCSSAPPSLFPGSQVFSMHMADINNDGFPDLIASHISNKVVWYPNINGTFDSDQEQVISTEVRQTQGVFVADLDQDGLLDVLSASVLDNKVAWYKNLGQGRFGSQQVISTQQTRPTHVSSIDMDRDGFPDVIAVSEDSGLYWFKNVGDGAIESTPREINSAAKNIPTSVFPVDLDLDGFPEVLGTGQTDRLVFWNSNLGKPAAWLEHVQGATSESCVLYEAFAETEPSAFLPNFMSLPGTTFSGTWKRLQAGAGPNLTHVLSSSLELPSAGNVASAGSLVCTSSPLLNVTAPVTNEECISMCQRNKACELVSYCDGNSPLCHSMHHDRCLLFSGPCALVSDPDGEL